MVNPLRVAAFVCVLSLGCGGAGTPSPLPEVCTAQEAAVVTADTGDRPLYHFTPPSAWMNDPAGLIWLAGEFHLFYQRDLHDVFTADTRWGHAVSDDLLHWSDLPDALTPDAALGVPFTGSAVVDVNATSGLCPPGSDCLVLVFTHAMGVDGRQKQSLAFSTDHGRTFQLYPGNPVLAAPGTADFRDPHVRWHAESQRWVMALGVQNQVRFFTSTDLRQWALAGHFDLDAIAPHGAVECPALLPLAGPDGATHWLLKVDVNPGLLQAGPSRYWLGQFDGKTFTPESPLAGLPFDGPDFYAAQAFANDPQRRVVWLGWLSAWSYAMFTPTVGYRGVQSLPRQLSLAMTADGLRLVQQPVAEVASLQGPCALVDRAELAVADTQTLLEDAGAGFVLTAELQPQATQTLGFGVWHGASGALDVGYDAARGVVFLDRTRAGQTDFASDFAARFEAPVPLKDGRIALQIYVDRTSIEVFAAGGLAVLSASVYPAATDRAVTAFGKGTLHDVQVRPMTRALHKP